VPYVKALSKSDLGPGSAASITLQGRRIAIFNVNGQLYAIDDRCTHDEASLAEGFVSCQDNRCIVECPWHGAHFDLNTGAALTLPAVKPVHKYNVRVEGDAIEVEL
jgi:3-phenylpropionate/trans-cinnamate dioxygenase ferredoxin subunit